MKHRGKLAVHMFYVFLLFGPNFSTFVFQYIGSLDVPRPNSRVEIVTAMRRIRVSDGNVAFQFLLFIELFYATKRKCNTWLTIFACFVSAGVFFSSWVCVQENFITTNMHIASCTVPRIWFYLKEKLIPVLFWATSKVLAWTYKAFICLGARYLSKHLPQRTSAQASHSEGGKEGVHEELSLLGMAPHHCSRDPSSVLCPNFQKVTKDRSLQESL